MSKPLISELISEVSRALPSEGAALTSETRQTARRLLTRVGYPAATVGAMTLARLTQAGHAALADWREGDSDSFPRVAEIMRDVTAQGMAPAAMRLPETPMPIPAPLPGAIDGVALLHQGLAALVAQSRGGISSGEVTAEIDGRLDILRAEIDGRLDTVRAEMRSIGEHVGRDLGVSVRGIVSEAIAALTLPREIVVRAGARETKLPAGHRHAKFDTLLHIVGAGVPALVVGPAGSGKTTGAAEAAKALGLSFWLQGAVSGPHEFLGFIDAHGRYHRTSFREAFENGGVFLADEIDGSDAAALLVLNAAISNGVMSFPDQTAPIPRHADFRLIAAANTFGRGANRQYVGRSQLDAATLDRFAVLIWDYDEKMELALSTCQEWTRYVQAVRALVADAGIRHIVSPRASILGGALLDAGICVADVAEMLVFKGLDKDARAKITAPLPVVPQREPDRIAA